MSSAIPRISVIGAGISGLTQAYYLQKLLGKCSIKIFESSGSVSGVIQTKIDDGFRFEQGPRSIRNGNTVFEVLKICENMNILDKIVPSDNFENVFIYYDGKLRQLPRNMAFGSLVNFALDHPRLLKSALRIQRGSKSIQKEDCTMEEFVAKKLQFAGLSLTGASDFVNTYIVNSFAKGVYRAESSKLSADLCVKKKHLSHYLPQYIDVSELKAPKYSDELKNFVSNTIKKSGSFNFTDGVQMFPNELSKFLQTTTHTEIALNSRVASLSFKENNKKIWVQSDKGSGEEFDYVISTVNAPQVSSILSSSNGNSERMISLRSDLDSIKQNPMVSINLGYKTNVIPPKSFGYLIPSVANQNLIGVVFDSCAYPTLGPKNSSRISLMFGDKIDINAPEKEFIAAGIRELKEQTGISHQPDKINFCRWEPSFTEYSVNHFEKSVRMLQTASDIHPNFQLHGKYLFTSAIPELTLLSKCFAAQITQKLRNA